MPLILIGGGSRSGKSSYALLRARQYGRRLAFLATAEAGDDEMRTRISKHQEERGPAFQTLEIPLELPTVLAARQGEFDAIVIDCLTLWLSNLMMEGKRNPESMLQELTAVAGKSAAHIILVTNEVGCGIVPDNALAREFRDTAGRLNQMAGLVADEVYWMVFGIPLKVK
jgi:adenosylcobinamide kinase / adenosylcobinamide-phosphate guanylyltransferase